MAKFYAENDAFLPNDKLIAVPVLSALQRKQYLTRQFYFDNIGNMEMKSTIQALAALAQESRLAIFRLLVVAGPDGMPVGKIAEQLNLANATLSFHLKELTNAGLTTATPNGRSISYSANFNTMTELLGYLTENCCAGAGCAPAAQSTTACRVSTPQPQSTPRQIQKKSTSISKRSKS